MSNLCVLCVFAIAQLSAADASSIVLHNSFGEQLTVWIQQQGNRQWLRPATIPSDDDHELIIVSHGEHYLVVRDQSKRDERLGWYDLRRVAELVPGGTIYLDSISEYQTQTKTVIKHVREQRTRTYTICKPVWESRSRTVTYWDPYTGQYYDKVLTYKVCKMVPETRTSMYEVTVPVAEEVQAKVEVKRPALKVLVNGQLIMLDEFIKQNGVQSVPQPSVTTPGDGT